MNKNQEKINALYDRIEILLVKQEVFSREIQLIKEELKQLQNVTKQEVTQEEVSNSDNSILVNDDLEEPVNVTSLKQERVQLLESPSIQSSQRESVVRKKNIEKFIGESLISKIGIVITVIGVAIGAKYAIENQYVSPLTRIIMGYLVGFGLLGVAIRLKKGYENFSAVLLSGSMAIMYFLTYLAYNFYEIIPQGITFALMLMITVFTVIAALKYNQQVIAHIGLVGAYAIPFLVTSNSGRIEVFFSYVTILNIGILAISLKKYWKSVYYSSFAFTWLIFVVWLFFKYSIEQQYLIAQTFLVTIFIIFYATFLAFKLIKRNRFNVNDIILLLANSFIFFFLGYEILSDHSIGKEYFGLFTVCNAVVHLIVSAIVFKQKFADRNLFYFVLGLVLVFFTIAIPVQLDGNWVTLLWAGEAAILFLIGRTRSVAFYEMLAYPLVILAFISNVHDWEMGYSWYPVLEQVERVKPIFNQHFSTSFLTIVSFSVIGYFQLSKKYPTPKFSTKALENIAGFVTPFLLLITIYFAIILELTTFFNQLYADSLITKTIEGVDDPVTFTNTNLLKFKMIWMINFSMLFFACISFVNAYRIRNIDISKALLYFNTLFILFFLTISLYNFSELRDGYLQQLNADYYSIGIMSIAIRYISVAFVALLVFASFEVIKGNSLHYKYSIASQLFLHIALLWFISSELISWMDLAQSTQSYKLGLSILWGVYSLLLIVLGLWKKRKHLRVAAIVLFGVTLVKLFLYDIAHFETISKTIVMVSLGILLLVISFLYNKYKHIVSDEG